jgi:DNA-binding transcriptional ArsR family regulator
MVEVGELAGVLAAMADPVRLQVVDALSLSPRRAGELARRVGVSAPVMSKHLRVLLEAGLVADRRDDADARVRVFRLRCESVVAVQAWLDQLQAQWDQQLAAFKVHAEGAAVRTGTAARAGTDPRTGRTWVEGQALP